MARSGYISSQLTPNQLDVFRRLDDREVLYFSMDDLGARIGQLPDDIQEIVENLAHKRLLDRVERGVYTRPQFHDPYVLASFIVQHGAIAYWTALHLHGLTDRFANTVFLKTPVRRRSRVLFGTKIRIVTVKPEKMVGVSQVGYGDKVYRLTDPEATILDCFDQPRYAGDLQDLYKAFHSTTLNGKKLVGYTEAYGNISAVRRMGFLAERLGKPRFAEFIRFAKRLDSSRYVLLDPSGPDQGTFHSDWRVRQNIADEALFGMINPGY